MKTLCFTGWQQPFDALKSIAPDATHFDYSNCKSIAEIADTLSTGATDFDIVIGWSLGAQIALKLINDGFINAERLVLFAPPWQIVQSADVLDATPAHIIDETIRSYKKDPLSTLEQFQALVYMGDAKQKALLREFHDNLPDIWPEGLAWLKHLRDFSCRKLAFSQMPAHIQIFQGDSDVIVPATQVEYFRQKLPKAEIFIVEGCCHAPHLQVTLD